MNPKHPSARHCIAGGALTAVTILLLAAPSMAHAQAGDARPAPFPVTISVDAARPIGDMRPVWRYFGADEPNYAYMTNGRNLIGELGKLGPGPEFFRAHNLLTTGDGTPALKWGSTNAYTEDAGGNPVYDWTIVDRIFDTYLARGVKPYVQIGFMPQALSVKPEPYRHHWTPKAKYEEIYTGWAYPPKDYGRWSELVFQWTKHCVERYGRAECESWWWQLWNEPNIGYWRGTREEFFTLYDHTAAAVRRALPAARVGGPETAGGPGGTFMRDFFEHCLRGRNAATGGVGAPLDFLSFHAKGAPKFVGGADPTRPDSTGGHVRMGVANQLRDIDAAFKLVASYPELKDKPIVIGESDPDGCAACQGPQLGYRNGTMYSSYTAASFARKYELADRHGVNLEGVLTWAFTFEDQPYFAGFRQLATNGVDLPVLNVFRMFGKMTGKRVAVNSSAAVPLDAVLKDGVRGGRADVGAVAAMDPDAKRAAVLAWHYHDDDVPGADAAVELDLRGLPAAAMNGAKLEHYRIDQTHSNAYTVWKAMGSPQAPTPGQYAKLEQSGRLETVGAAEAVPVEGGRAAVRFNLPRQAVSLLVLTW
jgi:xylan 1,4-beta-xylosidase